MEKNDDEPVEVPSYISFDAVAAWKWDVIPDICRICRNQLQDACIECQGAFKTEGCDVVYGECGHEYHVHCIERWVKTRPVCPEDNKEWKVKQ